MGNLGEWMPQIIEDKARSRFCMKMDLLHKYFALTLALSPRRGNKRF